jgi:hypothetical protein
MKIPEIKEPEDWYEVEKILSRLMLNLPEFRSDYMRFIKNVDLRVSELGKINIHVRKQPNIENNRQKKNKLKEINEMIRMFTKMHLLASLSKR